MNQQDGGQKFASFMELHRNMLDCFATGGMNPAVYKSMDAGQ